jgi:threonine synthase
MPAASYIEPRNGKLYPLDVARWRSDEHTPLLVTPAGACRAQVE